MQATAIDPSQLCLEITESLAMDDVDLTSSILTQAPHPRRPRGHRRLRDGPLVARLPGPFPVDVVKIDQSFVRDIDRDPVKSAIVSAVVALSEAIGSTTVVEGVETLAQFEEVKNLGCDVGPGLLLRAAGLGRRRSGRC